MNKYGILGEELIIDDCLQILCLLFKARDKSKIQFKEWISRILQNILLFLNAV